MDSERLSISESENEDLQKAFNTAARWIFKEKKSSVNSGDINDKSVQSLLNGINTILQDGLNRGIEQSVPYVMKRNLSENIYVFSGAKTYAELKELSGLLLDTGGKIKPFSKFWQDVQSIYPEYNQSYLEAEYIFATQSAQMASKWNEYETDGDRYNLQYRTASDDRVRESHWLLHNTTLPPSDPFWNDYYPPNGWRCRCTAIQVRKSKYPESDSTQAVRFGANATEGKNNIFRFNPGKQQVIFPGHHPYLKKLSGAERETLQKKAGEVYAIKTADDVVNTINALGKDKDWFERGFKKLEVTRRASVNGATDMDGRIWLTKERMDKTISGINKLSKGEQITFDEADSLSTFWHEITHNRNKKGNMYMTSRQTRYMELANEFVSRNTLSDFYAAFGAKLQHPELVTKRVSTGYNRMVNNYQAIISKTGLDKDKVVGSVKKHLFDEAYTEQKTGLAKALQGAKKADGTKLTKSEINHLIGQCDEQTNIAFDSYIDKYIGTK
jgi:SPP1 gp7 family putative phage head morphogenesis protein